MPDADSRIALCRTPSPAASMHRAVPLEIGTGYCKWRLVVWPGMKSRAWTDANGAVVIRAMSNRAALRRAVGLSFIRIGFRVESGRRCKRNVADTVKGVVGPASQGDG